MATFHYIFEDLPLITVQDAEACHISGEAVIWYQSDGEWEIRTLLVDGYRSQKQVYVVPPIEIYALVLARLEGSWRDKIEEAVVEQLEIDRYEARQES